MKRFFAEFIGTLFLVLIGCGAAVISGKSISTDAPLGIGFLGIALAFGLALAVMIYTIGPISGCHINPAVTLSMLAVNKISIEDSIRYITAQLAGATVGSAILYLILKGQPNFSIGEWGLGSNGWGQGYLGGYDTLSAFLAEAIGTFLFVFVIFATTSKAGNNNMAGLVIGLTLVLIHLTTIPITGTSINPARSFGAAIFAGEKALPQLWLFIIAPSIGGITAALVWQWLFSSDEIVTA